MVCSTCGSKCIQYLLLNLNNDRQCGGRQVTRKKTCAMCIASQTASKETVGLWRCPRALLHTRCAIVITVCFRCQPIVFSWICLRSLQRWAWNRYVVWVTLYTEYIHTHTACNKVVLYTQARRINQHDCYCHYYNLPTSDGSLFNRGLPLAK